MSKLRITTTDQETCLALKEAYMSHKPVELVGRLFLGHGLSVGYEFAGGDREVIFDADAVEKVTVAWNGPEDGLPPVGLEVIFRTATDLIYTVKILAHGVDEREKVAIAQATDDIFMGPAENFRPIRTAEQLAAEERQHAVDKMLEVSPVGRSLFAKDFCEALYDAGARMRAPEATK